MILTGTEIHKNVSSGLFYIDDFNEERLGPNSYNLRLHPTLVRYDEVTLDCAKQNRHRKLTIPESGFILEPGVLYIGMTYERTTTTGPYVPMIEGRSSVGRLGIRVHVTAGFGDIGFDGNWTLEIDVIHPVKIYPMMEICQIFYHETKGEITKVYRGKYQGSTEPLVSQLWREYEGDRTPKREVTTSPV